MNFIGHAHVALARRTDVAFVLGAMLPDFFGMAKIRGAKSSDPDLTAGIEFHHFSDDAFHRGEDFRKLSRRFAEELRARGVRGGPARAVAHVGLELLLDGFLVDRPGLADAYLAAVAEATPSRLGKRLSFTRPEDRRRYEELSRRLTTRGLPQGYRNPGFVRDQLVRILRDRPRLALSATEAKAVRAFLPAAKRAVEEDLEAMLGAVMDGTRDLPIG